MQRLEVGTVSTLHHMETQVFESALPAPIGRSAAVIDGNDTKPSSTTKLVQSSRAVSTPPEYSKRQYESTLRKRIDRSKAAASPDLGWFWKSISKRRSQDYDGTIACHDASRNAESRAAKDSLITAEIKLNCCLESEQEFLIDLVFLLSEVYQRPPGCIVVLVNTEFSIMLGNSSEPAYHFSITVLSSEIAVSMNKWTTGLIHDFMLENANIAANRGIVSFHAMAVDGVIAGGLSSQYDVITTRNRPLDDHRELKDVIMLKGYRSRKSSIAKPTVSSGCNLIGASNPSLFGTERLLSDERKPSVRERKTKRRKSLVALLGF